jgi:hypothetical protein
MCGVQCRPTLMTLNRLSTCPSDKEVTENVLFDARSDFTKYNICIFPYHYSRESDNLYYALPVGYLRPSQNTTLPL